MQINKQENMGLDHQEIGDIVEIVKVTSEHASIICNLIVELLTLLKEEFRRILI